MSYLGEIATPPSEQRRPGELAWSLAVHVVFLIVYTVIVFVIAAVTVAHVGLESDWFLIGGLAIFWLVFVVGAAWIVVAVGLIWWWQQGRHGLTDRTVALDLFLWLGPLLLFLTEWRRTSRLFIPPRRDGRRGTWAAFS